MNVGIFLEKLTETEIKKDPGLIASGLVNRGINVKLFTHFSTITEKHQFSIFIISKKERNKIEFWQKSGIDTLIIYSWLSLRYSKLINAAKSAGIKIILKLDSDGNLIYPLKPSYLKVFGLKKDFISKIKHILRVFQWLIFPKIISTKKIKQITTADALIIETNEAKNNLTSSLNCWGKKMLFKKIFVIPNPIVGYPEELNKKNNLITSIGRWDDTRKNTKELIKTLSQIDDCWPVQIIGKNSLIVAKKIKKNNPKIEINATEKMDRENIFKILEKTKIVFAPSIAESFNLVVAEALCCGCSFVGGNLPSFQYFSSGNKYGTLANDFKAVNFIEAIKKDQEKWNSGKYFPTETSQFWKKRIKFK